MATVYILLDPEVSLIKIGRATNFPERMASLLTANPRLSVVHKEETEFASKLENMLHKHFASHREQGEFFKVESDVAIVYLNKAHQVLKEMDQIKIDDFLKAEELADIRMPDERDWQLVNELSSLESQIADLQVEQELLRKHLMQRIGTSAGVSGLATWKIQQSARFDSSLFERDHPELHAQYSKVTASRVLRFRRFLRTDSYDTGVDEA
ncbi:GIY-YIG nuclease family protein [Polynucleobacter antarcticus]|uniref:Bacteriophage T5 Orf172 DNA-binding domain-containing protein n=1 Tax=Polynucleobacter antarcticus TaxID=1743162 RepID=A0A6M9PIF9_9BURK|nr:GIY-YIG nuclease family protein [Polynucleobacter antarcticus]QKM62670.1 hypothetical protein DCO16_06130 [Polynucleobacter antarcticus]